MTDFDKARNMSFFVGNISLSHVCQKHDIIISGAHTFAIFNPQKYHFYNLVRC